MVGLSLIGKDAFAQALVRCHVETVVKGGWHLHSSGMLCLHVIPTQEGQPSMEFDLPNLVEGSGQPA